MTAMRVLHLWKSDHLNGGGGAISLNRLHTSLGRIGIDSWILCEDKTTDSPRVATIPKPNRVESLLRRVTWRLGLNDIHRVSSFGIRRHPAFVDSDIIHFHGIHTGFINYLALPSLTAGKPAVFTLRDMWALTGHCAISYDCERWKSGCGKCPYPEVNPAVRRDATRWEWKLKDWAYRRSKLIIVGPSKWITERARESLLKRFPIYHIANGVDTEAYQPVEAEQCRSVLGIPSGKKVVMFAALELNLHHKGGDLLRKALQGLPHSLKSETLLLLLGYRGEAIADSLGLQTLNLGYISGSRLKSIAYSAADVFVHPVRSDNSPLVVLESLACGTPVVSFRVGGIPESVRPGVTGYLARPGDVRDLRDGIVQLLQDAALRNHMRQQCRAIAVREYSSALEARRYVELYRYMLQNDGSRARPEGNGQIFSPGERINDPN